MSLLVSTYCISHALLQVLSAVFTTAAMFSPPPVHSLCSVYIAQFEEYTRPMITHLLLHKVNHWDRCAGHMTIT